MTPHLDLDNTKVVTLWKHLCVKGTVCIFKVFCRSVSIINCNNLIILVTPKALNPVIGETNIYIFRFILFIFLAMKMVSKADAELL